MKRCTRFRFWTVRLVTEVKTPGERPSYEELSAEWKALRGRGGLSVREVACAGASRTLLIGEIVRPGAPLVAISAGVHGDEPAGPWALLSIVRDGLLDPLFSYRFWPCMNPSGYAAFTRCNAEGVDINRSFSGGGLTPESKAIITSNRDRSFALTLDLHEDFEASGFYMYENLKGGDALFCAPILRAVTGAGFELQDLHADFDDAYATGTSEGRTSCCGCVLTHYPESIDHFKDGLPYSLSLIHRRAANDTLTFETPRVRPWNERIAMHRTAVVAALDRLHRITGDRSA